MTTTEHYPFLLLFLTALLFQHCATTQQQTLWVAGIQADCAAGAGLRSCLLVNRGAEPDTGEWEYFYSAIAGFTFEAGYAHQIVVTTQRRDPKQTPADAATIRYTLVRELERRPDPRHGLAGDWTLTRLRGTPINRMVTLPTLTINQASRQISGNGGCNTYSGPITDLGWAEITLGNIVRTEKACIDPHIEDEYFRTLAQASGFVRTDETLVLYAAAGEEILSFMPTTEPTAANERLHDIWVATHLDGQPIERGTPIPRLEINLRKMRIMGNDGCNEYNGAIEAATATRLAFGTLAATKKMCRNMDVPNRYHRALGEVASYRLEELNLFLLDADGKEVLTLLKVD